MPIIALDFCANQNTVGQRFMLRVVDILALLSTTLTAVLDPENTLLLSIPTTTTTAKTTKGSGLRFIVILQLQLIMLVFCCAGFCP